MSLKTKFSALCASIMLATAANAADVKTWNYMLGEQNPYPAPESLEFIDAPEGGHASEPLKVLSIYEFTDYLVMYFL